MTGGVLAAPEGDPAALEEFAARLEAVAQGAGDIGARTRRLTTSIRSQADWTGDAADSYSEFTTNLSQGPSAAEEPLSQIASAIRNYAGVLRTAQQKVQTFSSLAEAAQNDSSGSLISAAELAGQDASAAVGASQQSASQAAGQINSAASDLENLVGKQGPVQSWINSQPGLGMTAIDDPGWGTIIDPVPPELGGGTIIDPVPPEIGGGTIIDPVPPEIGGGTIIDPVPPDIGGGTIKDPVPPDLPGLFIDKATHDEPGEENDEPGDDEEPLNPAENANKGALNKISESHLEDLVGDAHEFKQDILGKGTPPSRYNVYVDKSTGYLFLMGRGKGSEPIPTYVNIGDDE